MSERFCEDCADHLCTLLHRCQKERCPHGIRLPWQCDDCDRENPMPKGWRP